MHVMLVILAAVALLLAFAVVMTVLFGPAYYALFRAQRDTMRRLSPGGRKRFLRNEAALILSAIVTLGAALALWELVR